MRLDGGRVSKAVTGLLSVLILVSSALAADKPARLRVDDYQIEAELNPHSHTIRAKAK